MTWSPCRRLRSNHYKAGCTQQFNFRGERKYLSLNKFLKILSLKFSKETLADFNLVNIIRTLSRKHAMITSQVMLDEMLLSQPGRSVSNQIRLKRSCSEEEIGTIRVVLHDLNVFASTTWLDTNVFQYPVFLGGLCLVTNTS